MTWTGAAPVAPPPGYDPAHPERDPVGAAAAREAAARASAVRVEKAKLLREELKKCYKESGVNHLQDCAELVDKYMSAIKGGSGTEWINASRK